MSSTTSSNRPRESTTERATQRRFAGVCDALRDHALEVVEAGIVVSNVEREDQPIVYVNKGFECLTGYTASEVLGMNCRFLQGPETDSDTVAELRNAIAERREALVVIRNYRKDGTPFWNEVRLAPFTDSDDRVTHYTAIQTDVTARVEVEQRLGESEGQLHLLLQSTAEAIYGIDREGNCTFCNPSCAEMLGYDSVEELIGRDMHELIHSRLRDGSRHRREQCLIFKSCADGIGTHSDTEVFWRKDGTSFPVEYWSYPIRRGDEIVGSVVNFLDVSERQQAAERLLQRTRMLETVNQINLALAGELELSRLVQQVTDAGRLLTGAEFGAFFYSLPDDAGEKYTLYALSGAGPGNFDKFPMPRRTEIFAPTFDNNEPVRIDDVLSDERYGPDAPHRGIPQGHDTVRSYLAVPVVTRSGDGIGALLYGHSEPRRFTESDEQLLGGIAAQAAVAVDNARLYEAAQREIQERKQVELALDEACRAADQANRSKTEFLANMSHEIRTPMTAILGYADILAAHLDNPDNRECVDVIKRNGRFLLNIVDDILDLSRIEAGKMRVEPSVFRLDELVGDVRSLMEVRALEKNLPLIVEYAGEIPSLIETDPTRLRQILINLLSNAIKFTDRGSVRLLIEYDGQRDGHECFRFDVIDTGIGMDKGQLERIFRPFSQVDTSLTRQYEGTGLGLAISQRLAEMLGGKILIRSEADVGSTFSLHIRADAVPEAKLVSAARQVSGGDPGHSAEPRSLSCRVLVVDDRRDIRYLAQYFLEEAGACVMSAENGRAALDLVAREQQRGRGFDLVLMDMQMPVLDGYAATRTLRQRGFRNPILALTAGAMRHDREKSLQAGCDAHVAKPIDGAALVNLVAHYVEDVELDELQKRRAGDAGRDPVQKMTNPSNGGKRILVVDDSVDAAGAMLKLLQMIGHDVRTATSGAKALEVAREFEPEVAILDLGLPDIDGYAVARELRKLPQGRDCLCVALSGRDAEPEQLAAAGFEHHFLKPANLPEITAVIAGDKAGPGLSGRGS